MYHGKKIIKLFSLYFYFSMLFGIYLINKHNFVMLIILLKKNLMESRNNFQ